MVVVDYDTKDQHNPDQWYPLQHLSHCQHTHDSQNCKNQGQDVEAAEKVLEGLDWAVQRRFAGYFEESLLIFDGQREELNACMCTRDSTIRTTPKTMLAWIRPGRQWKMAPSE